MFALIERACPVADEDDANFAFSIESTTLKLPLVRFDYEVSPPPPPPLVAGVYDDMVADDPEGFADVRKRLEDWFPKLSHVATSSSGATVGEYIADRIVTPQQLTRCAQDIEMDNSS